MSVQGKTRTYNKKTFLFIFLQHCLKKQFVASKYFEILHKNTLPTSQNIHPFLLTVMNIKNVSCITLKIFVFQKSTYTMKIFELYLKNFRVH